MNSLILCEGESDLIVLSNYLTHRFGFCYQKNSNLLPKKKNKGTYCQYDREMEHIVIGTVEGCSSFPESLDQYLQINKVNDGQRVFSRIVIFTDYDSEIEIKERKEQLDQILVKYQITTKFAEGRWVTGTQAISWDENVELELLFFTVPQGRDGALETLLLDVLDGDPDVSYLAQQSRSYTDLLVEQHDKFSKKYLSTRRARIKVPLAVFLATISPERIYQQQKEIFDSIQWDQLPKMQEALEVFDVFER